MELPELPSFLNTEEKWDSIVQQIDTVEKYDDLFYRMIEDDTFFLLDIPKVLAYLTKDIATVHHKKVQEIELINLLY